MFWDPEKVNRITAFGKRVDDFVLPNRHIDALSGDEIITPKLKMIMQYEKEKEAAAAAAKEEVPVIIAPKKAL